MRFWKILAHNSKEAFCDVGSNVKTEWRVEPDSFTFSIFLLFVFAAGFLLEFEF